MEQSKKRESKILRREQIKLVEIERKRTEEENATPHISNASDLIDPKPNSIYIPSYEEETPIPTQEKERKQKIRKPDMSKFKNPVARKPASFLPMPPAAETTTSMMDSIMVATTAPSSDKTCKRWELPCPFCAQSTQHHSPVDSDWPEDNWHGDIGRVKRKEKKQ